MVWKYEIHASNLLIEDNLKLQQKHRGKKKSTNNIRRLWKEYINEPPAKNWNNRDKKDWWWRKEWIKMHERLKITDKNRGI